MTIGVLLVCVGACVAAVFVGILLYTHEIVGRFWGVIEKSYTICLRVYFYIPVVVGVIVAYE